jgi:hypothetical protein
MYTPLGHNRNENILEESKRDPLEEKLYTYRNNWLQHVRRMEDDRHRKQILKYHPTVRRRRLLKRQLDDGNGETESGQIMA